MQRFRFGAVQDVREHSVDVPRWANAGPLPLFARAHLRLQPSARTFAMRRFLPFLFLTFALASVLASSALSGESCKNRLKKMTTMGLSSSWSLVCKNPCESDPCPQTPDGSGIVSCECQGTGVHLNCCGAVLDGLGAPMAYGYCFDSESADCAVKGSGSCSVSTSSFPVPLGDGIVVWIWRAVPKCS